jgi:amidophosphoribosyltransferase
MNLLNDKFKDECGVFAIYDNNDSLDVSRLIYLSLYALQHRGQESCGISVSNGQAIDTYKDAGFVCDVFDNDILASLKGNLGIGHVRYSKTDSNILENCQPISVEYKDGSMAVAHNGNLTNSKELRQQMAADGSVFITGNNTELILKYICKYLVESTSIQEAVAKTMKKIQGAYAVVMVMKDKLVAFRDPLGIRPLCVGKLKKSYMISSESCSFAVLNGQMIRDIDPGEIIVIDDKGLHSYPTNCCPPNKENSALCVFEYVYFARPDSCIDGASVHQSRLEAGKRLADKLPVAADLVISVPDSANSAALGYARQSGIPYGHGLIRNRYVGRTFIQPTQDLRDAAVRMKLSVMTDEIAGKRIIMVDDSIVRGTTTGIIVKMLKEAGAKEVHIRICSPPVKYPCYYGINTAKKAQLVASKLTTDEIAAMVGADSLGYLSVEDLLETPIGVRLGLCDACFTGNYRVPKSDLED